MKINRIFQQDFNLGYWISGRKVCRLLPDKLYISFKYRTIMGRWPNLKNPRYLSEKLQWMKLYYKNDLYPMLVDKYEVRRYIEDNLGKEYLIPLIGVWDTPEDIEWDILPDKFVLKCTNGSHTNIICTDSSKFDKEDALLKLKKWMKSNQTFYYGREWPYKYVKPRIIAEKFIESDSDAGIVDYKFMCFNGKPDNVMICSDRMSGNTRFDHFDKNWNFLRYQYVDKLKPNDYTLDKPSGMDDMFKIAEKLSKPFPFVRVDLYYENNQIYFGELTFFPQSGFDTDFTPETDLYFGSLLSLNNIHFKDR